MLKEKYHKANKKKKERIKKIIERVMKKFKIKNYLIAGSFATRNYFKDIDIVILDKVSKKKMLKVWMELEKLIGIEIDLRSFDELNNLVKFSMITKSIKHVDKKTYARLVRFTYLYTDFAEWLKKWM